MSSSTLNLTWRGVIRGQLRQVYRRCGSLLAFQERHPDIVFLSPAQEGVILQARQVCTNLLGEVGSPHPTSMTTEAEGTPTPAATDPEYPPLVERT